MKISKNFSLLLVFVLLINSNVSFSMKRYRSVLGESARKRRKIQEDLPSEQKVTLKLISAIQKEQISELFKTEFKEMNQKKVLDSKLKVSQNVKIVNMSFSFVDEVPWEQSNKRSRENYTDFKGDLEFLVKNKDFIGSLNAAKDNISPERWLKKEASLCESENYIARIKRMKDKDILELFSKGDKNNILIKTFGPEKSCTFSDCSISKDEKYLVYIAKFPEFNNLSTVLHATVYDINNEKVIINKERLGGFVSGSFVRVKFLDEYIYVFHLNRENEVQKVWMFKIDTDSENKTPEKNETHIFVDNIELEMFEEEEVEQEGEQMNIDPQEIGNVARTLNFDDNEHENDEENDEDEDFDLWIPFNDNNYNNEENLDFL